MIVQAQFKGPDKFRGYEIDRVYLFELEIEKEKVLSFKPYASPDSSVLLFRSLKAFLDNFNVII